MARSERNYVSHNVRSTALKTLRPSHGDNPGVAAVPDITAMESAAALFHSFGDRTRLVILQHLQLGEHRVVDLIAHLGLSQSTVSKHLACLREAGIVTVRPKGRASVYELTHPEALVKVFSAAEELLGLTGAEVRLCPLHGPETSATERRINVNA